MWMMKEKEIKTHKYGSYRGVVLKLGGPNGGNFTVHVFLSEVISLLVTKGLKTQGTEQCSFRIQTAT